MSLEKPTIVLFDMDGTTVRHINPWLLHILERLDDAQHWLAKIFSKIFNRKIEPSPLVTFKDGKRKKLLVHRAIHRFRRKPVEEVVEPCPGIYEVLKFLKSYDIPMGIVSNGLGKGYGHDVLKKFGLSKYYEVMLFREDLRRAKPYPDPVLQALEGLKKKTTKTDVIWVIGDRHKDIRAAMAAELHIKGDIVPIAYGLNAAIAVLEHNLGPDHIVMAWPDILMKLKNLFKDQAPKSKTKLKSKTQKKV